MAAVLPVLAAGVVSRHGTVTGCCQTGPVDASRSWLSLAIQSVADMDPERALAVARVFDAHPQLRPRKVGGDPKRIAVEPSLEAVVAEKGLPIEWLTFREMKPDMEMGEFSFLPGRGGGYGDSVGGGFKQYLTGNRLRQEWGRSVVADRTLVEEVATLFEELVIALDAAWGAVDLSEGVLSGGPPAWHKLWGVFWINYFGPAFLARYPQLASLPGATVLPGGGALVRIAGEPGADVAGSDAVAALRDVFDARAFEFTRPNPALPPVEEHLAASPGTSEMPWVAWERARTKKGLERRHASSRRRLDAALAARTAPVLDAAAVEWSTSLDVDDWKAFAGYLKRKLHGDLSSSIGSALLAVIASAPVDEEDAVVLSTDLGAVQLGWHVDDPDTVDIFLWGPDELSRLCDAWFESD